MTTSTSIATVSTSFDLTFDRTSKAGKVSTRGVIGLMTSGSVAERRAAADALMQHQWDNGRYNHVLREFARVFAGKAFDNVVSVLALDLARPNKTMMLALLSALVRGTEGKPLKGEKALFRSYAVDLVVRADANAALREAAIELGVSLPGDVIAA